MSRSDVTAELWAGLITPSISSLAASSLVCMGLALLSAWGMGPRWLEPDRIRWLAASERDDEAFVAAQLVTLPRTPRDVPHVVLLGASSHREALTSASDVADRLLARLGTPVRVYELMNDNQPLEHSAGLARTLPDDVRAVVVVGVTLFGMTRDHDFVEWLVWRPHFGLPLPGFEAELVAQGVQPLPTTGVPLVDDRAFYLTRIAYLPGNLLTSGTEWRRHRYRNRRALTDEELLRLEPMLVQWARLDSELREHGPDRAEVLGRVAESIRDRGHVPVVLMGPRARGFAAAPAEAALVDRYEALMAAWSEAHDVEVWSLDAAAGLTHRDFADIVHLRDADATSRFTGALVDKLAVIVPTL